MKMSSAIINVVKKCKGNIRIIMLKLSVHVAQSPVNIVVSLLTIIDRTKQSSDLFNGQWGC